MSTSYIVYQTLYLRNYSNEQTDQLSKIHRQTYSINHQRLISRTSNGSKVSWILEDRQDRESGALIAY